MDYENVCIECGKPFISTDEDMNYCPACWQKVVGEILKVDSEPEEEGED